MQVSSPIQLVFPPTTPTASRALAPDPAPLEADRTEVLTERPLVPTLPATPRAPSTTTLASGPGVQLTLSGAINPETPSEYNREGRLESVATERVGHETDNFARQAALAMHDYYQSHPNMASASNQHGHTASAPATEGSSMVNRFWTSLGAVANKLHATA